MRQRTVRLRGHDLLECYDEQHCSDQAGRFLGRRLEFPPGAHVAEVGCGTGVLAFLAARLGAARVWASDVVPAAVELAREGARRNDLAGVVTAHVAPLLDAVPRDARLDVVLAVMPQRPAPHAFSARFAGGVDGADLL